MASFIKVAKVADVPEGSGKLVEAGGKQIALFNAGGKFFAIDNACKHRGGPLAEGDLDGTTVVCPGTAGNTTSRPARISTTQASSSDAMR